MSGKDQISGKLALILLRRDNNRYTVDFVLSGLWRHERYKHI